MITHWRWNNFLKPFRNSIGKLLRLSILLVTLYLFYSDAKLYITGTEGHFEITILTKRFMLSLYKGENNKIHYAMLLYTVRLWTLQVRLNQTYHCLLMLSPSLICIWHKLCRLLMNVTRGNHIQLFSECHWYTCSINCKTLLKSRFSFKSF